MYSARDIADVFVSVMKYDEDGISPLKVQKLLYFAQGFSYQRFGKPLFTEKIEAWNRGPAVNCVYAKYASFKDGPITLSENKKVDKDTEQLIFDVIREYGQYSTEKLVDMTHEPGTPWDLYFIEGQNHTIIPDEEIEKYFKEKMPILQTPNWEEVISRLPNNNIDDVPIYSKDWEL